MLTCSMSAIEWDFGWQDESDVPSRAVHVISRKDFHPTKKPEGLTSRPARRFVGEDGRIVGDGST